METVLAVLTILILAISSLSAVLSRKLIRAVLAFAVTMLFLGFLYMLLNQLFLGLVHIFIYVGGVAVLAAFAYITSISVEEVEESHSPFRVEGAVVALLSGLSVFFIGSRLLSLNTGKEPVEVSVFEIGKNLLHDRLLEFEIVSVLLVVSLVASLAFVMRRQNDD